MSRPYEVLDRGRVIVSSVEGQLNGEVRVGWQRIGGTTTNPSRIGNEGELAVINTGYPKPELLAVRLGSRGRIARADLVWTYAKAVSKRSSPLVIDGLLYMVSDEGIATCLSAESGAEVWKHRLNGRFSASPIYVDGHLIFFDEAGGATVMKPGKAAQPVSVNRLSAGCMGSPAVYGSSLIVRTKQSVLRLTGD